MNKHYRYCFECDKWLSKQEVNEIDWGQQPGGGEGKTWNCVYCRSSLGDQIQVFKCEEHETILKIWGVCEGKNKEKIFYQEYPKCQQQEQQPDGDLQRDKGAFLFIGGAIVLVGGLVLLVYRFFFKERSGNE